MTVRMVILGLLREQLLHGYEIKHIIEEHMGDWTSIAFGSIYFALGKLSEEGFVEVASVEQEGNRPSRSVYQITDSGREEFMRLLREGWQKVERQYYDFDVCLFFMRHLPQNEVKVYLQRRRDILEEILEHIECHRSEQLSMPEVPALADAIFNHTKFHTRAELQWVSDLITKLESGAYS
ncbi:MAG: PadR family transcriptional regulator [Spirochaetia bacterium]|nr:PadR family transcriptional regulator [Spirochaetia bacterium]